MTSTQSIILAAFAFFAGCVVTYIIKKANEYQRPMLPKRDNEFIDPNRMAGFSCPKCRIKMIYDEDRDWRGNVLNSWYYCDNCQHKEKI